MQNQIEAEMLEIIEKSREEWSHDVTDHTENEYIREGLLNAGYCKQTEGEWIEHKRFFSNGKSLIHYQCNLCGVYLAIQANYCPNCGAKMKGANNEHSKDSKKS